MSASQSAAGGDEFSIPFQSFVASTMNSQSSLGVPGRNGPIRVPANTGELLQPTSTPRDITEYPDTLPSVIDGPSSIRTLLSSRRRSSGRFVSPEHAANSATRLETSVTGGTEPITPLVSASFQSQIGDASADEEHRLVLATPRVTRAESLRSMYATMRIRDLKSLLDAAGVEYVGVNERRELIDLLILHDIEPHVSQHVDLPGFVPSPPVPADSEQGVPVLEETRPLWSPMTPSSAEQTPVSPVSGLDFLRALEAAVRSVASHRPVEAVDNREPGVLFRFTDDDVQFQFVGQNAHESQRQRRQLDAVEFLQQLSQLGFHLPQSLSPSAPTPIITPTHSAPSPERPISQMASLARTFSQFVKDSDLPSCQQWSEAAFFPRLVDFFNGFSHEEHGSVCEHPLIIASETNDSRVARALVSQGFVDAVVLSRGQKSALHVASELGHVEVLSCLLEVTTVLLLDAACEYGPTPLWAAASGNHVGAVKLLHGKGAGIDVPCHRTHTTPLWQACRCDCVDVVTWLLGNGADVNFARHSDGVTPLWIACASGHVNVVHSLLASGALVDQVPATDSQLTPFAVASSLGHLAITRMLLSHFPRGSIDVTLWDAASSNLHTLKHLV